MNIIKKIFHDDCYGKVSYFMGSHTKSMVRVDKLANSAMKEYTNERGLIGTYYILKKSSHFAQTPNQLALFPVCPDSPAQIKFVEACCDSPLLLLSAPNCFF